MFINITVDYSLKQDRLKGVWWSTSFQSGVSMGWKPHPIHRVLTTNSWEENSGHLCHTRKMLRKTHANPRLRLYWSGDLFSGHSPEERDLFLIEWGHFVVPKRLHFWTVGGTADIWGWIILCWEEFFAFCIAGSPASTPGVLTAPPPADLMIKGVCRYCQRFLRGWSCPWLRTTELDRPEFKFGKLLNFSEYHLAQL